MKDSRKKGRLVILLAKGYLGFTLALVLIAFFVSWLSDSYFEWLSRIPDIEALVSDKDMQQGKYEDVPTRKYLGRDGGFAVVTEDGEIIYDSTGSLRKNFTAGELDCIQPYEEQSYINYVGFKDNEGNQEHLLVKFIFEGNGDTEEQVMILDENYDVVEGSFGDGHSYYTPDEFKYLISQYTEGPVFIKYDISGKSGNLISESDARYLVVMSYDSSLDSYQNMYSKANRIYLLLIPLYMIAIVSFLLWMNRRIKKPLVELNNEVDQLASGGKARLGEMEGPWEIRMIGSNMDRMADMLAESEADRKKLDDERQRLLADISHDLKTPITVISGYTKAIRDGKVPPEKVNSYLELIDSRADELNRLINSFHEYSKVEHPEFSINPEETDICEFMRGYLAERYDEINISGFSLNAMIPETPVWCSIDKYHMRRALDNIIYNSIKHNGLGTVIAVGVTELEEAEEGKQGRVKIILADNGIGISKEEGETIFDPFVMGDKSRSGGGSGLGLAITRRVITAHGGIIRLCEPRTGGFSTEFEIILPTHFKNLNKS
ncbi:MAG: HAMP domain-containing histidine kinase [Firmicutes bacterium]|nr:HAMP domain-containing histidine kinase [Bacillota bacterium]